MLPVLIRLDVGKLEAGMQMFGSQRLSLTSLPLTFPNLNACSYSGTPECPSLLRTLSACLYFTPPFSAQQSMFGEGSQTSSCCRKFSTALVGASDGSKGLLGLQVHSLSLQPWTRRACQPGAWLCGGVHWLSPSSPPLTWLLRITSSLPKPSSSWFFFYPLPPHSTIKNCWCFLWKGNLGLY